MDYFADQLRTVIVKSIGLGIIVVLALIHATELFVFYDRYETPEFSLSEAIHELASDKKIDFTEFEQGNWKKICIFGGYTYPYLVMRQQGSIGFVDKVNGYLKRSPLRRLGEVEEFEFLISYIDQDDQVGFIHSGRVPQFDEKYSLEHLTECIEPDDPVFHWKSG